LYTRYTRGVRQSTWLPPERSVTNGCVKWLCWLGHAAHWQRVDRLTRDDCRYSKKGMQTSLHTTNCHLESSCRLNKVRRYCISGPCEPSIWSAVGRRSSPSPVRYRVGDGMLRESFGRVIDSVSESPWTARSMARTTRDEKSRVGIGSRGGVGSWWEEGSAMARGTYYAQHRYGRKP
jgi:hypothetical protein